MKQTTEDYIPHADPALRSWLANFKNEIAALGGSLGYTVAQTNALSALCVALITTLDNVTTAQDALKSAVTIKETLKKTNIGLIRAEANKIKANPATPAGALESLGLTGSHHTVDEENYQPDLSVSIVGGLPTLKFTKKGVDSMKIMHRLKGATTWSLLAVVSKSPYIDHITLANPAVAEHWEYQCYGLINDAPIGKPSDIVHVVFAG